MKFYIFILFILFFANLNLSKMFKKRLNSNDNFSNRLQDLSLNIKRFKTNINFIQNKIEDQINDEKKKKYINQNSEYTKRNAYRNFSKGFYSDLLRKINKNG